MQDFFKFHFGSKESNCGKYNIDNDTIVLTLSLAMIETMLVAITLAKIYGDKSDDGRNVDDDDDGDQIIGV